MKQFIKNEEGVSYSIFTIFIMLIYLSAFWMLLGTGVDVFSEKQDIAVDSGKVSEQTQKYYNNAVNIFKSNILFGIAGLVLWGIRKSKFDNENDTTSMGPLFGSITIMLVLSFVSIILIFALGQALDQVILAITNTGLVEHADISETSTFWLVDLFYIACILPAIAGVAIHILTSVEKITYGSITEESSEYDEFYQPGAEY